MFNPNARWDRPLPQQESNSLAERIRVYAFFDIGKISPRFFIRKGKLCKIKKTNYFWQERQGEATLSFFSVETNAGLFQISFNNKTLNWKLDKIID